ncbi:hypothetical protein [Halobellus sp. GM3]|uniref:hypothetical protein n=1 Tax=Halobellus sp. GM3 TaxID=3458410 RepID=UPI00403DE798
MSDSRQLIGMESRRQFYVAGFVGASIAYIFTVLAFTGSFNVLHWTVFAVVFFAVFFGFEKLIVWADATEPEQS